MILLDFFALYVVPAHAGGVDLSQALTASKYLTSVPAHAGGVDLSDMAEATAATVTVPAHAGGVDLSSIHASRNIFAIWSPPMRAGWI